MQLWARYPEGDTIPTKLGRVESRLSLIFLDFTHSHFLIEMVFAPPYRQQVGIGELLKLRSRFLSRSGSASPIHLAHSCAIERLSGLAANRMIRWLTSQVFVCLTQRADLFALRSFQLHDVKKKINPFSFLIRGLNKIRSEAEFGRKKIGKLFNHL